MTVSSIYLIGAAHWDIIAQAHAPLGHDADVPGQVDRRVGGVAANVALALARLGAPNVQMIGVHGPDPEGIALLREIEDRGVACSGMMTGSGPTDCYVAIETATGELYGAVACCQSLDSASDKFIAALDKLDLRATDHVVLDGNLGPQVLKAALELTARCETNLSLLSASPHKARRLVRAFGHPQAHIYLNLAEAEALTGIPCPDSRRAAEQLREMGAIAGLITDGPRPVTAFGPDYLVARTPTATETHSATGAGDALAAAHIYALAQGLAPDTALDQALSVAAAHIFKM